MCVCDLFVRENYKVNWPTNPEFVLLTDREKRQSGTIDDVVVFMSELSQFISLFRDGHLCVCFNSNRKEL
jgi:hypothetical protein